jgi:outer membrane protein OmpA-like peptidoglycan-associated protein
MKNRAFKGPVVTLMGLILLSSMLSCARYQQATRAEKGAVIGGAAGTATGVVVGSHVGGTKGAIIGGVAGALLGGLAGHQIGAYMDRQEEELRAVAAQSEAMSVARSEDVLIATFKSDILFDFDSSVIKPGAYSEIDRVASVVNRYPHTMLRVEGHTDASGSEAYNQQLSEERAIAVKNALVQKNVIPDRILTVGYGETMPVSSSAALNRRVNIVIIPVQREG